MASSLLVSAVPAPGLRLPCPPPAPEVSTRFGLLLRRLSILHGATPLRDLDAETALSLLDRCAASEEDRHAVRAFTPLVTKGFLKLLDRPAEERSELSRSLARQVTIRPELLEQIATRISPLVSVTPVSAMEALALSRAGRAVDFRHPNHYNGKLWLGVSAVFVLAVVALGMMAQGMRRSLDERKAPSSPAASSAPSPVVADSAPVAPPAAPATPAPAVQATAEPAPGTPLRPVAVTGSQSTASPDPATAAVPGGQPQAGESTRASWLSCAALPSPSQPAVPGPGSWSVLAPASSLAVVRQKCRADASSSSAGVLVARFQDRSQAQRLSSSLEAESGLSLQIVPTPAP